MDLLTRTFPGWPPTPNNELRPHPCRYPTAGTTPTVCGSFRPQRLKTETTRALPKTHQLSKCMRNEKYLPRVHYGNHPLRLAQGVQAFSRLPLSPSGPGFPALLLTPRAPGTGLRSPRMLKMNTPLPSLSRLPAEVCAQLSPDPASWASSMTQHPRPGFPDDSGPPAGHDKGFSDNGRKRSFIVYSSPLARSRSQAALSHSHHCSSCPHIFLGLLPCTLFSRRQLHWTLPPAVQIQQHTIYHGAHVVLLLTPASVDMLRQPQVHPWVKAAIHPISEARNLQVPGTSPLFLRAKQSLQTLVPKCL